MKSISTSDTIEKALSPSILEELAAASGLLAEFVESGSSTQIVVTGVGGSEPIALLCADLIKFRHGKFCNFCAVTELAGRSVQPESLIICSATADHDSLVDLIASRLSTKRKTLLLTLNPNSRGAVRTRAAGGHIVAPQSRLVAGEFIATVNSLRMAVLLLNSLEQHSGDNLVRGYANEVRMALENKPDGNLWADLQQGCVIVFSPDLRACAADVELRLRENGVAHVLNCDQLDLVHGGYVQIDSFLRTSPAMLLVLTSPRHRNFSDALIERVPQHWKARRLVFDGEDVTPSYKALAWSVCGYAQFVDQRGIDTEQKLPEWGRGLWDLWR
jgi:hypothetical protein